MGRAPLRRYGIGSPNSQGSPPTGDVHQEPSADTQAREKRRLAELVRRLSEDDPSRKFSRRTRLLLTFGPFVGVGILVVAVGLLRSWAAAGFSIVIGVASFVGGGKFTILAGMVEAAPLGVWPLAHVVILGDIVTMLVLVANMHLLYRVPWAGRKLARAHEASHYVLKANPWMRRLAWFALAIFVAVPFQGTGAVGGTILARLLGMSQLSILTAIPVGSVLGCYPIALLGVYGQAEGLKKIADNPLAALAFFAVLVAVIVVLGRRFTGSGLRKREGAAPAGRGTDAN